MTVRVKKPAAALLFGLPALWGAILYAAHRVNAGTSDQVGDRPPDVTIAAPKNHDSYSWNSLVNYRVVVTYQGKSTQYDEIPSNQILLRAAYLPDVSAVGGKPAATRAPAGLLYITQSKCLGCHAFNAKAMGPSFAAVGQRYPESQAAIALVSEKIRHGSTGLWGPNSMPPQPDLTDAQLHAIALWITRDAADPRVHYYVGTEGTFRMEPAGTPDPKAGMMLTASYTNLAPGAEPEQAPHGEDTVTVDGK